MLAGSRSCIWCVNYSVCSGQQSGKLRPFLQSLLAICDRAGMCGEAERWSPEAVRESILSCSSICIWSLRQNIEISSIIYCLLGYIGMAQNDTPKIRVFIPSFEPGKLDDFLASPFTYHESYNGLPLVAHYHFFLVSFYVETKKNR